MNTQRALAYGWGLGLVVLSAWPAWREPAVDSYPLSTYPMFSHRRGQPWLHRMVALDRNRNQTPLPPRLVANAETLQAAASIRRAVVDGKDAMRTLCHEVAARVATDPDFTEASSLQIQAVRYDPVDYFVRGKFPIASETLMRCPVRR